MPNDKAVIHAKALLKELERKNIKPVDHPEWQKIDLKVRMFVGSGQ